MIIPNSVGRAYAGPFPNRAHRTQAEIAAQTASAADHDVLAYLRQRADAAARIARISHEGEDLFMLAHDRVRQIEVMIGEIEAGLHHGADAGAVAA